MITKAKKTTKKVATKETTNKKTSTKKAAKKTTNPLTIKFNVKDEYYTPRILVEPIIEYIPKGSTVWCPFDTENSEFVLVLREYGYKVIHRHLWEEKDFFEYEPTIPNFIYSKSPLFSMVFRVLGTHSAPIPHQFFAAHHF